MQEPITSKMIILIVHHAYEDKDIEKVTEAMQTPITSNESTIFFFVFVSVSVSGYIFPPF